MLVAVRDVERVPVGVTVSLRVNEAVDVTVVEGPGVLLTLLDLETVLDRLTVREGVCVPIIVATGSGEAVTDTANV